MEFDHGTETISPDDTVTTITIGGTGGLILPAGTTAQRPANTTGIMRWNTDLGALEVNNGSGFGAVGGSGGGAPTTATYLTLSTDAGLSNERVLTPSSDFVVTDGGAGGTYGLATRKGGDKWDTRTLASSQTYTAIAYNNGRFVAVPGLTASSSGATSIDNGRNWSNALLPSSSTWLAIFSGNGMFLLTPGMTTQSVSVSAGGSVWTTYATALPTSGTWYAGCFFNGLFYLARYGSTDLVMSSDGKGWKLVTLPVSGSWTCMAGGMRPGDDVYGNLVLVGGSATTSCLVSSDYGATWTQRTIPAVDAIQGGIAFGNGTFVISNNVAGGGSPIYSTDNGMTWASATVPAGIVWGKIAFGAGQFVMLSVNSTVVLTSPDGVTWTQRSLSGAASTTPNSPIAFGGGVFAMIKSGTATGETSDILLSDVASGGTPGLLYNDNGSPGTATGVGISGNGLWFPTTEYMYPPPQGVSVFAKKLAGRTFPAFVGPSGMDVCVQPAQWRQKVGSWTPPGNVTTAPGISGLGAFTAQGTATARAVATTNLLTRMRRIGYVSAATAGAFAGHYSTAIQFTTGDGAGLGGFFFSCRFAASDAVATTSPRMFIGMQNSSAVPTNVEPNTITNCIGVAQLSTSTTQLYIVYGGSAAQTAIALGTNFPPMTAVGATNGVAYDFTCFAPPSLNGTIYWRLERIGTSFIAEGTITPGTPGTQTPLNTVMLAPRMWRCNNAQLVAVGLDIINVYIETDY